MVAVATNAYGEELRAGNIDQANTQSCCWIYSVKLQ
jgi:hypothetical protein